MRHSGRKAFFGFIALALTYIVLSGIIGHFTAGRHKDPTFDQENSAWVASSPSFFDRALCRWFGLCGGLNFLFASPPEQIDTILPITNFAEAWTMEPDNSEAWSKEERKIREIPQYVLDYAPYVHLHSKEQYWPTDVAEHLAHTSPSLNYTALGGEAYGLANLDKLNAQEAFASGRHVYLESADDVESLPDWLSGRRNIPRPFSTETDANGKETTLRPPPIAIPSHRDLRRRRISEPTNENIADFNAFGRSNAPAFLIVIPKEDGVVDAFWFFFYSFNKAPKVLNIQFGNHVGDWEHTLVRFRHGVPESVSCSEHFFGQAYTYDALEKYLVNKSTGDILSTWSNRTILDEAKRPVIYSAAGSHAMHAKPGVHPYILPFNLLRDETDRGPLWDPTLNLHAYTYDFETFRAATRNPRSPTGWLNFAGRWGDKYYKLSDSRQYRFAGQYHYLSGPWGPRVKKLDREKVCQNLKKCVVQDEV